MLGEVLLMGYKLQPLKRIDKINKLTVLSILLFYFKKIEFTPGPPALCLAPLRTAASKRLITGRQAGKPTQTNANTVEKQLMIPRICTANL